jgi:hypothetical protein
MCLARQGTRSWIHWHTSLYWCLYSVCSVSAVVGVVGSGRGGTRINILGTRTADNEDVKRTEWVQSGELCVHVDVLGTLAVDTCLVLQPYFQHVPNCWHMPSITAVLPARTELGGPEYFVTNLQFHTYLRNSPRSVEPENSLECSQQSAASRCPESH